MQRLDDVRVHCPLRRRVIALIEAGFTLACIEGCRLCCARMEFSVQESVDTWLVVTRRDNE